MDGLQAQALFALWRIGKGFDSDLIQFTNGRHSASFLFANKNKEGARRWACPSQNTSDAITSGHAGEIDI